MKLSKVFLLSLLGLALTGVSFAQESALSLQQCIEIAQTNHSDVITAENNISIARQRLVQQKSSYMPQVSIENNAFKLGDDGVLTRSSTGTALTVNQNIYDGGLREAGVSGASDTLKQREHALLRTRQSVTFNVTKAYYSVLRSKRLEEVAEANVKYNTQLCEQIRVRAEFGDAAAVDVLPAEAQLADAKLKLLSSSNNVRTALVVLQNAIGLSPVASFDIQDVPDEVMTPLADTAALLNTALKSRPDLLQAQAGISQADSGVKTAKIKMQPRPTIKGSYSKSISGGFKETGGQIIGGFTFDVFSGGANRAAFDEAKTNRANAEEQLVKLKRDIASQIEQSVLNVTNARERVEASQISLEAARKNSDVQKERYNLGLAITLDLLNAEAQLVTSQSNLVQARYDYLISLSELHYALGE